VIEGEWTRLRPVERADTSVLHALLNDERVLLGWGMPGGIRSSARLEAEIEGWLERERHERRPATLVIETLDGDFAGLILLQCDASSPHAVELSIALDPAHWHRGLATDALRTLVDVLFDEWRLHRVQLRCEAGNERASALYERLGFRLEGTLRDATFTAGRFTDQHVYGLLSTDERP
jgi:RimJ/RimL family protein N-acetyltransferase